ncbi:hypothetical protein [Pseudomonas nicosulfuronedens]
MRDTPSSSRDWTLAELENAYQHGFDTALRGEPGRQSKYSNAVLAAGWEAGWEDGIALIWQRLAQRRSNEGTPLMTMQLKLPSDYNSRSRPSLAGNDYSQ